MVRYIFNICIQMHTLKDAIPSHQNVHEVGTSSFYRPAWHTELDSHTSCRISPNRYQSMSTFLKHDKIIDGK